MMSAEGWITIGVIVAMVLVMAANAAGPDLVLVAGVTVLLLTGVIEPSEALSGFSNPAVITIAALFVVAAGVKETGGLDLAARVVLG
ncbi:MAG: anion permease, partial [Myxococcales bacterium]